MKLIFSAVALVFGAALPRHVAGHFTLQCSVLVLTGANLQAECDNDAGELEFTSINLNNCVAFLDDQLECGNGGGYTSSCTDCSISQQGMLSCSCTDEDGDISGQSLGLNNCIFVNDGNLAC
ncbi:uncharacterized protein N7484_011096 [Penicillium longicatenatum]|uniref:uncharacterized protein n=1 Tax=Penicillium longicatenatum TaxID=1561947 RepID=UPI002546A415|nr:uncharacterized protein N7484_011096 [Penicillium longicatenatum]KAJ5630996.1 hypothetical protein N7484_011096 [Penicillium longicatenatum]